MCLRENEVSLWSIGVIFGRFHVFSVPVPWRRWMILSKPRRQPVEGSADRKGVDHGSGGNAPRDHPSDVRGQRVWLALADIQIGWLWAVEEGQMVTTEVASLCELDPSAELLCGKLLLMQRPPTSSFVWKNVCGQFWLKKAKARKLVGKSYISKVLYKKALLVYKVPPAEKKSVVRSEKTVTTGSFGDGPRGDNVVSSGEALGACGFDGFWPPCWGEGGGTSGMG